MISAVLLLTLAVIDIVIGLAGLRPIRRTGRVRTPGGPIAFAAALVIPACGWLALATPAARGPSPSRCTGWPGSGPSHDSCATEATSRC